MTDNPFTNTPLPWSDPAIKHEYDCVTGALPALKISEYVDRSVLLVSKIKGQSMVPYIRGLITEGLQRDIEKLRASYPEELLQQTLADLLQKRSESNMKREKTKALNLARNNNIQPTD